MKTILSRHGFARAAFKYLIAIAASLILPGVLSAQTLPHRYSFASDTSDSVGTANGTIVAPGKCRSGIAVTISNGLALAGGGGGGFSGYVSLPAGILNTTTNITVECWFTQNTANTWATPWAFANNGNQNFAPIPHTCNNGNNMEVAFTPHGNENDLQSGVAFPSGSEQYVSVTFNNSTLVANLYTNAIQVATLKVADATYTPGIIGGGLNINALGNDIYGDPQFQGTIYEFRIWNGVVSQRYLSASQILGPGVVVTNLTPTTPKLTAGSGVILSGTEQAAVTVELAQTGTNDLLATSDVTNWFSGNTNILTVNSSGLISGVGLGTATVSAKVAGVTVTSGNITVTPQVLTHRYSFVSDGHRFLLAAPMEHDRRAHYRRRLYHQQRPYLAGQYGCRQWCFRLFGSAQWDCSRRHLGNG